MLRFLNVFLAAWLLLALPLGQHEALLHALGHAADDRGAGEKAPSPDKKCEEHSLYTAFAGALGSSAACIPVDAAASTRIAETRAGIVAADARHHYLSQAPPAAPARR